MKTLSPTVKVVLYKSTPTADGRFPVKIRVIFNRKTKYYSLGVYAAQDSFNETIAPPVINYGKKADNKKIADQFTLAERAVKSIEEAGKGFTFHLFEREYQQRTSLKSAAEFIDSLVEEIKAEERFSTAFTYRDCRNALEGYRMGLLLSEIDHDFLNKYARHLHKRLSPGSVGLHLRTLRAVINTAISRKAYSKDAYPFKGFTGMPNTKSRSKKALTKERIKELHEKWKKLSKNDKGTSHWQSLSLFLFSYFVAGINLEDILKLTYKNLKEGDLKFVRNKTKQEIEIPLHPSAAQIIADFSSTTSDAFLFPFLEKGLPASTVRWRKLNLLKKINADLKIIAAQLGIASFTFYSARHSFASVLHNQNTATSDIGDYLGHTSEATTKNYIASIQTERKKETFDRLI